MDFPDILILVSIPIVVIAVLLWYIRKQAREFHRRLTEIISPQVQRNDVIASAHAAALLSARFPQAYMPVSNFTMNPVNLQALLARIETVRPSLIVEVGCGESTLVIASAARSWGGRVMSFEEDNQWLELCRHHVKAAELSAVVDLNQLNAPQDISQIVRDYAGPGGLCDFLIIDGPYDPSLRGAREEVALAFREVLAPNATIYLDDTRRLLEQNLLDRLSAEFREARVEDRYSSTGFAFVSLRSGESA